MSRIVHVVGTGTIGEPLIGLFTDFAGPMGIDEVTFHKRTPLVTDRSRLTHLQSRGAKLAVSEERVADFEGLGHTVSYTEEEAVARASVVIDCTPAGNRHKEQTYEDLDGPVGFLAQGSESGFGLPYARGVNDEALDYERDRFVQIVSCNTHNITTLVKTLCAEEDGSYSLDHANFVCMRRANDITQSDKFVPSPNVGRHEDEEFGTHHARDAHRLFATLDLDLDLYSSAVKLNTQYMHSIWFKLRMTRDTSVDDVIGRLRSNPRVALSEQRDANLKCRFGRDHGYYGRILSQTVVSIPTLSVRRSREVYGFCFTPQDGNSLLSSIAATLWRIEPDWQTVHERIQPIARWLYREV